MLGGRNRLQREFPSGHLKEEDKLEDLGVDERLILKEKQKKAMLIFRFDLSG